MDLLLILPILVPLISAIVSLIAWGRLRLQRTISIVGALGLFICSLALLASVWKEGILTTQIGNWPAPFGITLVADLLSAIMVAITGLMGAAVACYSLAYIDRGRESFGYYPLFHVLLMGVVGAFLTGDLFNLYVWFEVMLISSFVLMELGGEKAQLEGAIKYVTINLVASAFFLTAIAILYGAIGTLNMADAAMRLRETPAEVVTPLSLLFLLAFGIKAAIFPLFFWLPASYHTPPAPVSAIFAGLLTKVGVYALLRVFTLLFVQDVSYTHGLILVLAALTMITGVLGAVVQDEFRRILSFHIVSQIGYMILGLGLFTPLAVAGSIFYIVHHIIVKTNLFLIAGFVHRLKGSYALKRLGGVCLSHPGLSVLFMVPALSLAGLPPLSGFWAKFILAKAGLEIRQFTLVAIALLVGLLTLFSMMKIWAEVFWKKMPISDEAEREEEIPPLSSLSRFLFICPIAMLAACTVFMGLFPEPMFLLARRAAEQLIDPQSYIRAVLGGLP